MNIPRHFRAAFLAAFIALGANFAQAQQTVQTWLMLNPSSQETFFVTDPAEQTRLAQSGWKINGTGFLPITAQANTVAMQRLVKGSSSGSDRIFAISPAQVTAALRSGYTSEGVMGQVSATKLTPDLIPVYRFTKESRNLWLIDKDQPWVEKSGWKLKAVAFWLQPKSGS